MQWSISSTSIKPRLFSFLSIPIFLWKISNQRPLFVSWSALEPYRQAFVMQLSASQAFDIGI
uniref:Unclassified n=1 Tax=Fusarium clavum TaxID=2594811 RepID=W1IBF3_9HYPO|nr:unclassified [Fusarium clavum]CEF82653.1 unclassified [Fusarium clavum]